MSVLLQAITPFFLVQGWEPRKNIDTLLPQLLKDNGVDPEERAQIMNEFREIAVARIGQHQQARKEQHDKGRTAFTYVPGDLVLHKRRRKRSLESYWIGPYKIINNLGTSGYLIEALYDGSQMGKLSTVHGRFLKLYREEISFSNPLAADENDDDGTYDNSDSVVDPPRPFVELDPISIHAAHSILLSSSRSISDFSTYTHDHERDYAELKHFPPVSNRLPLPPIYAPVPPRLEFMLGDRNPT